jgi:hypothetical protein
MKRLSVYAAVVAPLLLLLLLGSAGATAPTRTLKHVSRPVAAVAMDSSRVVYVTDDDAIRVWNIQTGTTTKLRTGSGHYMEHPIIPEVAIAGNRAAWITSSTWGNSRETWTRLYTRSLRGSARQVAEAFRSDGYSDGGIELWKGDWLGGLVGSGNALLVSRWATTPKPDETGSTISNPRLSLIEARRPILRVIAAGNGSIVSASADGGRVAVLRPDDSVGIFSASGQLLRQIIPSSAQEIAYGGGRLVVLTDTKTLEVYDAKSGALLHAWPTRSRAAHFRPGNLRAYGRIGVYFVDVYSLDQRMHLVDLATGKEIVLAPTQHPWGTAGAAVGRLGLVYSVNTYRFGSHPVRAGTLVFLSTARVLSMLAPKTPNRIAVGPS